MKKLLFLCLSVTAVCGAELMDQTPDGKSTYNQWGDSFQKQPNTWEVDPGNRKAILGLTKKKTTDIVIYPTPRGN